MLPGFFCARACAFQNDNRIPSHIAYTLYLTVTAKIKSSIRLPEFHNEPLEFRRTRTLACKIKQNSFT
jgi:hypothetical protein